MELSSTVSNIFGYFVDTGSQIGAEIKPVLVSNGKEALQNAIGITPQVVSNDPAGQAALQAQPAPIEVLKNNSFAMAAAAGIAAIALAVVLKKAKAA